MNDDVLGRHPDLDTLRRFGARALPDGPELDVAWHLFLCPDCRKRLDEAGPRARALYDRIFAGRGLPHPPEHYLGAVARAAGRLRNLGLSVQAERAAARELVERLRRHPQERRRLLVQERDRMRSFTVAEALLLACRADWSDDPSGSEELADLALLVLDRLEPGHPPEPFVNDLRAEAWGCIANCRRIRSDLRRVSEAFQLAETFLRQGSGNPLDAAGLLDLEASYLIDQRSFTEAEAALERLEALYREAKDRHREGRTLMQLARLRREQGRTEEAISLLQRAGERVDLEEEPHLELLIRRNLAGMLAEAGRAEEARAMLPELRRLARERADRPEWLRLLWTEGFVYQRLGHRELAATALAQARDGFAALGLAYDAALVGLELALLHLATGDTAAVRTLGAEMLPVFTSRAIHREALAALALVRRAMEEERLTRRLVEEVMSLLRRAREQPPPPGAAPPEPGA